LILGNGVESLCVENSRVTALQLEGGQAIEASAVLSSMGYLETLRRCSPAPPQATEAAPGKMSFMESIFVLDREPRELGFDRSIVFFCTRPRFEYRVPGELVDVTSGVLCCPNNFRFPEPLPEGILRLTHQANFELWDRLPRKEYIAAKKECRARGLAELATFFPDFSDSVVFIDSFTPKTIHKYTGHIHGAVYGCPDKVKNGVTPVKNLFICGTDQGFLGIIGATLSGISMANFHVLQGHR